MSCLELGVDANPLPAFDSRLLADGASRRESSGCVSDSIGMHPVIPTLLAAKLFGAKRPPRFPIKAFPTVEAFQLYKSCCFHISKTFHEIHNHQHHRRKTRK